MSTATTRATSLTRKLLRASPLPDIADHDDKESRGQVLVIGGSTQVPGALLLAGVGALRAGAGKLQLATVRDAAIPLALAVPESLVVPLPTTRSGEIAGVRVAQLLEPVIGSAQAVLVGPGMLDARITAALLRTILPLIGASTTLVLDGVAVVALRHLADAAHGARGRLGLTPHAGEMASLLAVDKAQVTQHAPEMAQRAADTYGAVVALKGAETWIATPDGPLTRYRGGTAGLGTSGSGDTLAGIVAGLVARGAPVHTAVLWGVWAHGAAGRRLSRRMAPLGFLARELLAEVPALVNQRS